MFLKRRFPEFLENTVVPERNLLEGVRIPCLRTAEVISEQVVARVPWSEGTMMLAYLRESCNPEVGHLTVSNRAAGLSGNLTSR